MKSSFVEYVVNDLLDGLEGVRARAMFGGHGVYKDDTMFAIIVNEELYFKAGNSNVQDFKSHGSEPFRYTAKGKRVTMSYWKLPAEILEDRLLFKEWAKKAIRAASASRPQRRR